MSLPVPEPAFYYLYNQFNDIANMLILESTVDFCKKTGRFKCIS